MTSGFAYFFDCPKLTTTFAVDLTDDIFADAPCSLGVAN